MLPTRRPPPPPCGFHPCRRGRRRGGRRGGRGGGGRGPEWFSHDDRGDVDVVEEIDAADPAYYTAGGNNITVRVSNRGREVSDTTGACLTRGVKALAAAQQRAAGIVSSPS